MTAVNSAATFQGHTPTEPIWIHELAMTSPFPFCNAIIVCTPHQTHLGEKNTSVSAWCCSSCAIWAVLFLWGPQGSSLSSQGRCNCCSEPGILESLRRTFPLKGRSHSQGFAAHTPKFSQSKLLPWWVIQSWWQPVPPNDGNTKCNSTCYYRN